MPLAGMLPFPNQMPQGPGMGPQGPTPPPGMAPPPTSGPTAPKPGGGIGMGGNMSAPLAPSNSPLGMM